MGATISVCVCTSGRPAELARCLKSLEEGDRLPTEVIVSDDSPGEEIASVIRGIAGRYPFARYSIGPRRGLCANRNHAVELARGSHVSLLDDDAVASRNFIFLAYRLVERYGPHKVLTGDLLEHGDARFTPKNPTFLGFFGRPIGVEPRTIHLNVNVIPRRAFATAKFDERIIYGYEDMDLCEQLARMGYQIVYCPELTNEHHPPARQRADQALLLRRAEEARIYVGLKRYLIWRRRPDIAAVYLTLATVHMICSGLRRGTPAEATSIVCTASRRFLGACFEKKRCTTE
jgi:GT2 family glycosyltransferase